MVCLTAESVTALSYLFFKKCGFSKLSRYEVHAMGRDVIAPRDALVYKRTSLAYERPSLRVGGGGCTGPRCGAAQSRAHGQLCASLKLCTAPKRPPTRPPNAISTGAAIGKKRPTPPPAAAPPAAPRRKPAHAWLKGSGWGGGCGGRVAMDHLCEVKSDRATSAAQHSAKKLPAQALLVSCGNGSSTRLLARWSR